MDVVCYMCIKWVLVPWYVVNCYYPLVLELPFLSVSQVKTLYEQWHRESELVSLCGLMFSGGSRESSWGAIEPP